MKRYIAAALAGAILPLALLAAAVAMDATMVGDLKIENAWTRATPPRAKVGGGYVTITNTGSEADRLVSGSVAFAGVVEIHEMAVTDGVMKMRPLADGLEIPAGETVTLKPGGFHIMFMKLKEGLVEGETVSATLTFEKAGPVELKFQVAPVGAKKSGHGGHTH